MLLENGAGTNARDFPEPPPKTPSRFPSTGKYRTKG
jgi:hypothetical protein